MRFFYKLIIFLFCVLCVTSAVSLNTVNAFQSSDVFMITEDRTDKAFFPITSDYENGVTTYRLLNILPLNSVRTENFDGKVYLGGRPLGVSLLGRGVVVVGTTSVITENGERKPMAESGIAPGDVLLKIDETDINSRADIPKALKAEDKVTVRLTVMRNDKEMTLIAKPEKDVLSGERKLGLYVKDGVDGIGTLTYVRVDNGRFGALGHTINDSDTGKPTQVLDGKVYELSVTDITKGRAGRAGSLNGIFIDMQNPLGEIDRINSYGLYGKAEKELKTGAEIKVMPRTEVKIGKAQIVTTIDGNEPDYYDIEIVKASSQPQQAEKGMVIKVTDERLLKATGGIVQGMSGSPIVQNNKLAGAVTHVFINDPTRGYGLYIDFMLAN